jgi:hypothetical protein
MNGTAYAGLGIITNPLLLNGKLVLIEILDFKQFMSDDIIAELMATS